MKKLITWVSNFFKRPTLSPELLLKQAYERYPYMNDLRIRLIVGMHLLRDLQESSYFESVDHYEAGVFKAGYYGNKITVFGVQDGRLEPKDYMTCIYDNTPEQSEFVLGKYQQFAPITHVPVDNFIEIYGKKREIKDLTNVDETI